MLFPDAYGPMNTVKSPRVTSAASTGPRFRIASTERDIVLRIVARCIAPRCNASGSAVKPLRSTRGGGPRSRRPRAPSWRACDPAPPDVLRGGTDLSLAGLAPCDVPAMPIAVHVADRLHALSLPRSDGREYSRVEDLVDVVLLRQAAFGDVDVVRASWTTAWTRSGSTTDGDGDGHACGGCAAGDRPGGFGSRSRRAYRAALATTSVTTSVTTSIVRSTCSSVSVGGAQEAQRGTGSTATVRPTRA